MKRITLALLVSAAALAANSARAESRVRIGINVGGPAYCPAPSAVVYAPAPVVVYAHAPAVVIPARSHGYWKEVQVKTWVPERCIVRHDRWGRHVRIMEPGYFTYHTERVWDDGRDDRGYRGDYDNRGSYSYGYGHNRGNDYNRGYDSRSHDSRDTWNR